MYSPIIDKTSLLRIIGYKFPCLVVLMRLTKTGKVKTTKHIHLFFGHYIRRVMYDTWYKQIAQGQNGDLENHILFPSDKI